MTPLLAIWIVSGGVIGGLAQYMFALSDTDNPGFTAAFWFAVTFYDTYHDQINSLGLAIGVIFISIAVLPGSVLILSIFALNWLLLKFWELFKFIFRRKQDKGKEVSDGSD